MIATHSPLLLAYSDAAINLLDGDGIAPIVYDDSEHYRVTRDFLANREAYLRRLLAPAE